MANKKLVHKQVFHEIRSLTAFLIEVGLADDQNPPIIYDNGSRVVITYPSKLPFSATLKDRPYGETYEEQLGERSYNVRLLDGGLLQLSYEFDNDVLLKYRLAFAPSPSLLEYQNFAELYREDVRYLEVIEKKVVTVPVRFDYDLNAAENVHHPVSHLTLGQYTNCRLAATAPLTPYLFIEFVLRAFYNTAARDHTADLPKGDLRLKSCISADELALIHVGVPGVN